MKISDFLSQADVELDVRAGDKIRLLRQLSTRAATQLGLNPNEVATEIAKREELGSTGVGNGVALPHARVRGLKVPFGLFARLTHAIDFEAIDDQSVDLVFLLLLPDVSGDSQLNALACVARTFRDPQTLQRIRAAGDRGALFRAITNSGAQ
jgi:nitrogen PTS system EIIA component